MAGLDEGANSSMAIQDTGITLCRENKGSLEALLKCVTVQCLPCMETTNERG